MGKRKKNPEGGANWMDTYGDMVTLLLCFFVMLYSMSSINKEKWEKLVRSFNPNIELTETAGAGVDAMDMSDAGEEMENMEASELTDFDQLYQYIKNYVNENNLNADVEVTKGEGFTFITFRNNVFFDGDSYVLKEEGKILLDDISGALKSVSDQISEIRVLGHTSQARPDVVNELVSDRFLSSNRATIVLVYLQQKDIVDPYKLVSSGYGQFRSISPFDTTENRAKNRRVELMITKEDGVIKSLDEYYREAGMLTEQEIVN